MWDASSGTLDWLSTHSCQRTAMGFIAGGLVCVLLTSRAQNLYLNTVVLVAECHSMSRMILVCLMCMCCRHHAPEVLQAVLLQAFAASGLFLLAAWLPSYFMQLSGMAASTALLIHTLNMAALTGSMLLGGLLADEFNPAPVLLATCAVVIAFGWLAWLLFSLGVAEVTWFAQCILCVLVGLHWGALTEVLLDMFPPGVSLYAGTQPGRSQLAAE